MVLAGVALSVGLSVLDEGRELWGRLSELSTLGPAVKELAEELAAVRRTVERLRRPRGAGGAQ